MTASKALILALVSLVALQASSVISEAADSRSMLADSDWNDWKEFKEFQEFQAWKKASRERRRRFEDEERRERLEKKRRHGAERSTVNGEMDPPPIDQAALMARYIVNQAAWTSVATVSSRKDTESYPFVNIISFSDGPLGNGTGIPYLFLTPLDFTAQDLFKDNRATLMMSLAQGRYCEVKNYDPMDPRCARVVFSGKIKEVKEGNPEYPIAKNAVYGRHPWLAHMPANHHFFFAKLKIGTIAVLDTFGGPKYVTVKDYLNPPNPKAHAEYFERYMLDDDSHSRDSQKAAAKYFSFS